jgi:CSLREA domain-containing protein
MCICRRSLLGAALAGLCLHASVVSASTITVTTPVDDLIANGNCTLREAVIAANTDQAVDACAAGQDADLIMLPAGHFLLSRTGPGEDAALTGDLDVLSAMKIIGAGSHLTKIDGGSRTDEWGMYGDRVFHVLAGGHLAVTGISVRGGYCTSGGGFLNYGRLRIHDSDVRDNIVSEIADYCGLPRSYGGAGIDNAGDLEITNSRLIHNQVFGTTSYSDTAFPGGGLLNRGVATVEGSVIQGNWAGSGSGIRNAGDLQVRDTVIDGNGARFYGAGLHNTGAADLARTAVMRNVDGGILTMGTTSTLRLENVTVSGNSSYRVYGNVYNWGGTIDIANSTIAGNFSVGAPAGIHGPATIVNTIVFNGLQGDCAGAITSLGYNLDGDGTCGLSATGDWPGSNPLLGLLTNNGGPTPTHALLPGSPAIDRIPSDRCLVPTDQRGVSRPAGGACDAGAYEYSPAGEVALIIDAVGISVKAGQVTAGQAEVLTGYLQAALASLTADANPAGACASLLTFEELLRQYVALGQVARKSATPLIEASRRVRLLVCP